MSRTVYVNGAFLPEEDAKVSIFDRGFLFADAIYEVTPVLKGRLVENEGHMARLARSLGELKMDAPVPLAEIPALMEQLVRLNGVEEGVVYLQISRGAADREFTFPKNVPPTFVMFTQARPLVETKSAREGLRVITLPDQRWGRRDIKTVQLLASSLAKMAAKEAGADDAWMVEDGFVTEGSSNNAWIVTKDGTLVTRHLSAEILHGVTRRSVMALAQEAQMKVEERPFTVAEALDAAEAFITSASSFVTPVVGIDGQPVGEGVPGPLARRLREIYIAAVMPQD